MTPHEVATILQDPQGVPDSDDEEDQEQWKVQMCSRACIFPNPKPSSNALCWLLSLVLLRSVTFAKGSSQLFASCAQSWCPGMCERPALQDAVIRKPNVASCAFQVVWGDQTPAT